MSGGSNQAVNVIDEDGNAVDPTGVTGEYQITDVDDDSDPKYYGFVKRDGSWYIMQSTTSGDTAYRYINGTSGYTTNWTNRAGLAYTYFYSLTW